MRTKLVLFCLSLLYVKAVRACKDHQPVFLQPYMGTTIAYPEKYPEETGFKANCSWTINAPSGYNIVLHPVWSCSCRSTITLYDNGSTALSLEDYSIDCPNEMVNNSKQIIQTGLSQVHLVLSTMSSSDEGGLRFRFMAVEINKGTTCESGGTRLLASRTPNFITSPGFPSQYQKYLNCTWLVEPAVPMENTYLVLEFRSQFLEQISASIGDCYDYVKIDGLGGEYCEEDEENILQTHSRILIDKTSVSVSFVTDHSIQESGFVLAFYVKEFLKPLRSSDSVVGEGQSLWIQSETKNSSLSSVQWFCNGISKNGPSSRLTMKSFTFGNGTVFHVLNISRALQRDEGIWTVKIFDGLTTGESSISIKVLPKPVLRMEPKYDFSILSDDDINIQCSVLNPESIISGTNGSFIWQKHGKEIVSGPGFNISNTNTMTNLTKQSAKTEDSGTYSCSLSGYHNPVLVSINVTVAKPGQKRCPSQKLDGITWNATIMGRNKKSSCPKNQKGTATRYCDLQGAWDSPNLVNCTNEAFFNASKALGSLIEDGVDNQETLKKAVNNTLLTMKTLTSNDEGLSSGDLSSSLDILDKIVTVTNRTGGGVEKEAFFEVVDNVLSTNNSESWNAVTKKTDKAVTSLLKSIDSLSEVIMKQDGISAADFNGNNLELAINRTKIDETGVTFPNTISKDDDENATFLELPKQHKTTDTALNYVAVIYRTISDILPKDSRSQRVVNSNDNKEGEKVVNEEEYVDSGILSLSTQTDLGDLSPPIYLTFQHINKDKGSNFQAACVSWNFTTNQWSEKGCTINSTTRKSTICQCNHLTNFAILMRPYVTEKEASSTLKMLSLIGVILSIAFTFLTFVVYIMIWKHIKTDQNILLLSVCGSLVLGYIVFLTAVENTSNEIVCTISTAAIHYFFLVTFFCMLGMGIYYFMIITVTFYAMYVANNFKSKSRIGWFLLGGWGMPFIIVGATLGGFWGEGYHLKNYCWLSMESGSLYLFIVPVCVIAVINVCIILSLMRVLCASSAMKKSSLYEKSVSGLRSLGTLLPVLGVTWILGVLAVNEDAIGFQFAFIIANSLQGLFIFLSHVLLNKKVMCGLKTKYSCLCTCSRRKVTVYSSDQQPSASQGQLIKELEQTFEKSGKSFFNKTRRDQKKVASSDSFLTEDTVFSESCGNAAPEKVKVMLDIESKEEESKIILEEPNDGAKSTDENES